jgi:hypothetical protein
LHVGGGLKYGLHRLARSDEYILDAATCSLQACDKQSILRARAAEPVLCCPVCRPGFEWHRSSAGRHRCQCHAEHVASDCCCQMEMARFTLDWWWRRFRSLFSKQNKKKREENSRRGWSSLAQHSWEFRTRDVRIKNLAWFH